MSNGEEGYTVPWAMWADLDRNLWINPHYSVRRDAFGTAHLRIRRENGSIVVDPRSVGDYHFQPITEPSFVGHDGSLLPVVLRKF